jgi:hypothetical protein
LSEAGLSAADQQKVMYDNARRILGLKDPVKATLKDRELAPA